MLRAFHLGNLDGVNAGDDGGLQVPHCQFEWLVDPHHHIRIAGVAEAFDNAGNKRASSLFWGE